MVYYSAARRERMLKRVLDTKKLIMERFKKFDSEFNEFTKMVECGKWEYTKLRKQWNKVNVHLIRLHDLDNKVKEYYDEAYKACRF